MELFNQSTTPFVRRTKFSNDESLFSHLKEESRLFQFQKIHSSTFTNQVSPISPIEDINMNSRRRRKGSKISTNFSGQTNFQDPSSTSFSIFQKLDHVSSLLHTIEDSFSSSSNDPLPIVSSLKNELCQIAFTPFLSTSKHHLSEEDDQPQETTPSHLTPSSSHSSSNHQQLDESHHQISHKLDEVLHSIGDILGLFVDHESLLCEDYKQQMKILNQVLFFLIHLV